MIVGYLKRRAVSRSSSGLFGEATTGTAHPENSHKCNLRAGKNMPYNEQLRARSI